MRLFHTIASTRSLYIVLQRLSTDAILLSNAFLWTLVDQHRFDGQLHRTVSPCRVLSSFSSSGIHAYLKIKIKRHMNSDFARIIALSLVLYSAITGPGNFGTDRLPITHYPGNFGTAGIKQAACAGITLS